MTGDATWFTEARFGMFIHWGLYALGARHEWLQQRERMSAEHYERKYFPRFDPDLYDPAAWADAAADAGMKYLVVTSKHHEGFCLWDSALTDYKAPNTPAGRDLLRPMLDAFRARGLRTGLYYSVIDWHHPDFTVDFIHPLRDRPDRDALNEGRDMQRYRDYLHGQVRELLTEMGDIDVLWADFSYEVGSGHGAYGALTEDALAAALEAQNGRPPVRPVVGKGAKDWGSEELLRMIRELRPNILLNDRLGLPDGYDLTTPEQAVPASWPQRDGKPALWEVCHTFSGSWGYHRDETTWKSPAQLLALLVEVVGKGGNLLLNVGPTGRGEFDARALERLAAMGRWMRANGRSIYGCTQTPDDVAAALPPGMLSTWNPATSRLYLHLPTWPTQPLRLAGLADRVTYAQLLHDASEVARHRGRAGLGDFTGPNDLYLGVPGLEPNVTLPVVEVFVKPA